MASRKIVIADESLTVQKIIKLALASEGHEILTAANGGEAFELIHRENPEIVLVDFSLPHLDAFSLKAKVDQHGSHPRAAWVLMQRADDHIDPAQFQQLGFAAKIVKPFDIEPSRLKPILLGLKSAISSAPPVPPPPPKRATPPPPPPQHAHTHTTPPMTGLSEIQFPKGGGPVGEDIRQLTEATVRETGLDQFGWSMNEPGKSPVSIREDSDANFDEEPTLRPPSRIFDLGPGTQEEEPQIGDWTPEESAAAAPPPLLSSFEPAAFNPPPAFDLHEEPALSAPIHSSYEPLQLEPSQPRIDFGTPAPAPTLSDEQIEAMVKERVEDALQSVIRKMLPDLAERMIKEEIHRILMNPPN